MNLIDWMCFGAVAALVIVTIRVMHRARKNAIRWAGEFDRLTTSFQELSEDFRDLTAKYEKRRKEREGE